jgi:hypothetical protein
VLICGGDDVPADIEQSPGRVFMRRVMRTPTKTDAHIFLITLNDFHTPNLKSAVA